MINSLRKYHSYFNLNYDKGFGFCRPKCKTFLTGHGHGHGHGGGYHRSTDEGAVVQSRLEEIPLGKPDSGTNKSTAEAKKTGSAYSYNSPY